MLLPLGTAYINEYLPHRVHNRMAVLGGTGFGIGGVLAAVAGVLLTPSLGWQVLFYLGAGAAVLGVVYLAIFPESIEYLVAQGKIEHATRLLGRIRAERIAAYRSAILVVPESAAVRDWRLTIHPQFGKRSFALWA